MPRANALLSRRPAEQAEGQESPNSASLDQSAELSLALETWKMPLPLQPFVDAAYPPLRSNLSRSGHKTAYLLNSFDTLFGFLS